MNIGQNLKKKLFCLSPKKAFFDIFFKRLYKGSFEDLQINRNYKSVPLCPIKWRPFKPFAKLYESLLLIANVAKLDRLQKFFLLAK